MNQLVLLLCFALLTLYPHHAAAQSPTPPSPEEYLVNPDVFIEDLPAQIVSRNGWVFTTPLGELRTAHFDNLQRLFLQYNEEDWIYFDVPPDWGFGANGGTIEVFPFPDGTQILYCNHAVKAEAPVRTTGIGIIIEPLTGNVRRVETCYITPNGTGYVYSEELVSPNGENTVVISPTRDLDEESCPPADYMKPIGYPSYIFANGQNVGCLNASGIEGRGWISDTKLLLRTFEPSYAFPIEYWYQLDIETSQFTQLGMTMQLPSSLLFDGGESAYLLDDGKTLVRWMIDSVVKTERNVQGVFPDLCKVEVLDLTALNAISFGQTEMASCLYYPEMSLTDAQDRLLYVHTVLDPETLVSTSTPVLIDLTTKEERRLSISGTIVHIQSISPDGKRALLVVDQSEKARYNPYENGLAYEDPRWVVYDLDADVALYTSEEFTSLYGHISEGKFGFKGFTWTPEGWQTIVDRKSPMNELSLLISTDSTGDTLTEIPLDALTEAHAFGDPYYVDASPDGMYYYVASKSNRPTYMVETSTGAVVEWTRPDENLPDGMYDSLRWRADGSMEIAFRTTENLISLARWRVDPAQAFSAADDE